jgi:hypothetical protein
MDAEDPVGIRRQLTRGGRGLSLPLGRDVTMAQASASARRLETALGPDVTVFASPGGGGPILRVLQLADAAQVAAVRPALEALIAEFRETAAGLVGQMEHEEVESVRYRGANWCADPHGEHCRFENEETGEIVEAQIYFPDRVDPYFLLEYARTSGRHHAVVDVCVEGFHDMCRLLDDMGVDYR